MPALSRSDLARFDAWFNHESSLPDIARSLNLPITELADWAAQPHIKDRLDAVKRTAEDRNQLLHVEAKHHALYRLTTIVTRADNSESARKAATRILMTRLDDRPRRHAPPALPPGEPPANASPLKHQHTPAPEPSHRHTPARVPQTQLNPAPPAQPTPLRRPADPPPIEAAITAPPAAPIDFLPPGLPPLHQRAGRRPAAALFARAGAPAFSPTSPDSS